MKIFTVATKPFYNYTQANRLLEQFDKHYDGKIEMFCYTDVPCDPFDSRIDVIEIPHRRFDVERQWNKIDFFSNALVSPGEVILIADLDWTFLSNVTDIIDTPVQSGEFVGVNRWWFAPKKNLLNGGMYKFISGELNHVYKNFYTSPLFWQSYFIHTGNALPPVNGEQNFVEMQVQKTHKIKWFQPFDAIGRIPKDRQRLEEYNMCYITRTENKDFFYLDDMLNNKIRMLQTII